MTVTSEPGTGVATGVYTAYGDKIATSSIRVELEDKNARLGTYREQGSVQRGVGQERNAAVRFGSDLQMPSARANPFPCLLGPGRRAARQPPYAHHPGLVLPVVGCARSLLYGCGSWR